MANNLTIDQTYAIFNSINNQATGKTNIAATNTYEFVTQAQTALKTGYDPVMNAISQVLSKTVFSVRPYTAQFKGFFMDAIKWGNHVRKLSPIDTDLEADARYTLTDGQSVDQWKINKPKVLQTNYYGQATFHKSLTFFKEQLDTAFSSPTEFGSFISMVLQNVSDILEMNKENVARMTIVNMIGAKRACDSDNVIYLLDKYNDETGESLTAANVFDPANFPEFAKWLVAYIKTLTGYMTTRNVKYHKNYVDVNGNTLYIARHTPYNKMKCYLYEKVLNDIDARVKTSLFNDQYMKLIDNEAIKYWQSIETPMGIQVKPSYVDAKGVVVDSPVAVTMTNIFGIIFDEEAIGATPIEEYVLNSGMNSAGAYYNLDWHNNHRWFNDLTENCVVLVLDNAPTLSSIEITTEPTKVTYAVGDYLDLEGMVVKATYSDGFVVDVTDQCITSPDTETALATTDTSVTVTFGTETDTFAITVS